MIIANLVSAYKMLTSFLDQIAGMYFLTPKILYSRNLSIQLYHHNK